MFESLSKIANVKSYLREQTELYFRQIVEEFDTTELYFNGEVIRISKIAVEPKVITNERIIDSLGISPQEVMDDDKRRFATRGDVVADMQSDFYERISQSETYKQVSWSKALEKKKLRLVVKGEPGGGKSFMTKCTAIEIAKESLRKLDSFETVTEDIEFPIWLTANDLGEFRPQDSIEQNLTNFVQSRNQRLSEKFLTRFGEQINNAGVAKMPKFFVFVDGLDELYGVNYHSFSIALQKLYHFPDRIIITCDQFQWGAMQGLLKQQEFTENTLTPFQTMEQEALIEEFFSYQPKHKDSLKILVDGNSALQNCFSSPLLLTFACLLHQAGELNENTTDVTFCELIVAKLFDGTYCLADRKPSWMRRNENEYVNPSDKIVMMMALFDEISWQLLQRSPESKEFTLEEWQIAFTKAIEEVEKFYPPIKKIVDSLKFRNELLEIRLLVTRGKQKWSYLHQTILECTATRAFSNRKIISNLNIGYHSTSISSSDNNIKNPKFIRLSENQKNLIVKQVLECLIEHFNTLDLKGFTSQIAAFESEVIKLARLHLFNYLSLNFRSFTSAKNSFYLGNKRKRYVIEIGPKIGSAILEVIIFQEDKQPSLYPDEHIQLSPRGFYTDIYLSIPQELHSHIKAIAEILRIVYLSAYDSLIETLLYRLRELETQVSYSLYSSLRTAFRSINKEEISKAIRFGVEVYGEMYYLVDTNTNNSLITAISQRKYWSKNSPAFSLLNLLGFPLDYKDSFSRHVVMQRKPLDFKLPKATYRNDNPEYLRTEKELVDGDEITVFEISINETSKLFANFPTSKKREIIPVLKTNKEIFSKIYNQQIDQIIKFSELLKKQFSGIDWESAGDVVSSLTRKNNTET